MMDMNSVFRDRKKVWSIASFLILFAIAFALLFKYDFGNFIRAKKANAESKQNKTTLDSLGEYKKYLKEFNIYLAPGNGIDWLMGTLTVTAKNNGVILSAIKPLDVERSSGYGIVKVSVEGVSSYKNLLRLVADLEDSKEHVFIDNITMKSIEGSVSGEAKNLLVVLKENVPRDRPIAFKAVIASVSKGV